MLGFLEAQVERLELEEEEEDEEEEEELEEYHEVEAESEVSAERESTTELDMALNWYQRPTSECRSTPSRRCVS
mgnify:CR=1 FL=1